MDKKYLWIVILVGIIAGISIANYKNFSIKSLVVSLAISFLFIASLSLFFIHTKIGRKIDKNKTKDMYDKLFPHS
jgi:uncharacterized membrane protein